MTCADFGISPEIPQRRWDAEGGVGIGRCRACAIAVDGLFALDFGHAARASADRSSYWQARASRTVVSRRLGYTDPTVGKWARRFLEQRIGGLYDEWRPGKPRSIHDERVAHCM